jgi:hypothetical protein
MQRAQKLQTESQFLRGHQINLQAEVAKAAAHSLGTMGGGELGGGGTFNPGAMMAGMAMGGAVGNMMANQMGGMIAGMNQAHRDVPFTTPPMPAMPPMSDMSFTVVISGNPMGPYTADQLAELIRSGQVTRETLVWTPGMAEWRAATLIPSLTALFGGSAPPPLPR